MNTEILRAECSSAVEALKESEERYRRLLDATTDYIYTVKLENGRTRSTSHGPGCEGVTGYSPADFSEDPYLWYKIIHEDDRLRVKGHLSGILEGKPPLPFEHRIVRRDGTVRWIRNTAIPHYNGNGVLVGYDGLICDITETKLSEEALRQSQERLALVIKGSTDGIWDWNVITNEAYFSPRWKNMLGYEDGEIENNFASWEALIHPDDLEPAKQRVQAYLAGDIPVYELEHRLRHKNGSYLWILARGVALRDATGRAVRMCGSHVDVTELRNTSQRLKTANQELLETRDELIKAARFESIGTLAAGVAHEVKNPLQTILMGLSLLERKVHTRDADVSQTLKDMRDSVHRANAIISDLLTLSRVTTFQLKSENLNRIIHHSLRLTKIKLEAARVVLDLHLAPDLPPVLIDESKIEQMLLNLFLNAIQAMPSGGRLMVTTRTLVLEETSGEIEPLFRRFQPGQRLVVAEVQDTGTGIKPEHLGRVWDAFFTTKPVGVGTGLGLCIARMIIDRHDGVIDLRNAAPGGALALVALKAEPSSCL